MSTAAPSWRGSSTIHLRLGLTFAAMLGGMWPPLVAAQATDTPAMASQQRSHAALAATIQALGGSAWIQMRTSRAHVRVASFFQGNPTGEVADAVILREFPDKERIELDKSHVVQIFSASSGWEITYKGKKNLPAEKVQDHVRRQQYSLRSVLGQWYRDPATTVLNEGAEQVNRRLAEKFTLINSANDAVTMDVDIGSHLPLRLSFAWRDPRFHDKNVDAIAFDNYHAIDGIATPFTVTLTHNGEVMRQQFVLRVQYNVNLPENSFNPDYAASHLK
ncbi:MAG TPA: hypothetical protein VE195_08660 [Acidobacteriaceae bacterium]|nr:hypothetical protein [Acidobacteriaceae bacterium]